MVGPKEPLAGFGALLASFLGQVPAYHGGDRNYRHSVPSAAHRTLLFPGLWNSLARCGSGGRENGQTGRSRVAILQ